MRRIVRAICLMVALGAMTAFNAGAYDRSGPDEAWPGRVDLRPRVVTGIGVLGSGGRVSTLEMVGLNPQPEPPSRPTLALYTKGASIVLIRISCSSMPESHTLIATGKGSNGLWYQLKIVDRGLPVGRARDGVGIAPSSHPPSPCGDPGTLTSLTAGDFLVR